MGVTLSIKALIDAQTTALNASIAAARDAVNTNTDTKTGAVTTAVNGTVTAARDAVNANTDTKTGAVTTAVNSARDAVNTNTDTKTGAVTTAVNAKGVIKSKQKISWGNMTSTVTIAAVDPAKSVVMIDAYRQQGGAGTRAEATITNGTTVNVYASDSGSAQIVEFF